jgi:hypothetical protein
MRYDDFRRQYDAVMQAAVDARLDINGLTNSLIKLASMRDNLPTVDERRRATGDLVQMQEILIAAQETPHLNSPVFTEASNVMAEASRDHGTTEERIERTRAGIQQIRAIADRAFSAAERNDILQLAGTLETRLASLQGPPRHAGR